MLLHLSDLYAIRLGVGNFMKTSTAIHNSRPILINNLWALYKFLKILYITILFFLLLFLFRLYRDSISYIKFTIVVKIIDLFF